jgi:pimeloyl-ACP methyl ester carboxylesterase
MKPVTLHLIGALLTSASAVSTSTAGGIRFEPYTFEARSGETVQAERGVFEVPENRSKPASRRRKLSFVRFTATGPTTGAPIVYLAGGPGASGVDAARGRRFPLFMALREIGDVIALDQRGTGWSNDIPPCEVPNEDGGSRAHTREVIVARTRVVMAECAVFWRERGIDLAGYNTNESADDVDELRRLLGAERVSLLAISYGTHLALATLKRHPSTIERAVLSSVEGLDETVKLPKGTNAFFARLQKAIDADPEVATIYPDIAATMRRVHDRLASQATSAPFGLFELQLLVSASISDPPRSATLPALYAQMDRGDYSQATALISQMLRGPQLRIGGMGEAMDAASGISPERARLVARQARTSLLGDALNFPIPHIDTAVLGVQDLGEAFRRPVTSDVPTLFLSGTLDGRTYPESAAKIARRFSRATHVIVENGGHNLFEADPAIGAAVVTFMKGKPLDKTTIRLSPPTFLH